MFVVFDIETTGFSEITCDVIEFSYALFDSNNCFVRAEQLYFYYEGMSWSEEAFAVHKIPLEFLKTHKDKFRENLIKMYSVLNHANVVGHNAQRFDCPFCKTWLMRQGLRNLEYGVIQDTMLAYRPVTKRPRIKLTKLIDFVGITEAHIQAALGYWFPESSSSHAHEAAYDVAATALLTLRGIEKKLIAFEPLVHLNNDTVNTDMINAMYSDSDAKELDPKGLLFHVASRDEWLCYPTAPGFAKYDMNVPDNVRAYYNNLGTVIPLSFHEVPTADESTTYELDYEGVKFTITIVDDLASLLIKTPYVQITNHDMDLAAIVKHNFGGGK